MRIPKAALGISILLLGTIGLRNFLKAQDTVNAPSENSRGSVENSNAKRSSWPGGMPCIEDKKALDKANQELNHAYQQILKEYASDALFIKTFTESEKAWLKFRDLHVAARYPAPAAASSRRPQDENTCKCMELYDLTQTRIKQLQIWINGFPIKGMCESSIKRHPAD